MTGLSPARCQPPCVTEAPTRRPTIGVTPPPMTTLVNAGGLFSAKMRRVRSGDVFITAPRASQRRPDTVTCPP
jgi:hypothetical protein